VGWRGYLSPKLEVQGIKPIYIYIIVGLIWVSWHLPFMSQLTFLYVREDLNTFIPRYFLNGIVLTFVYHELRIQPDSLWPPVIFHATGNAMGHILAAKYVTLKTGTDSIGAIGTGYISIVLYLILGLILYSQRSSRKSHKNPL
jgi:membrane protease YdiL (CAAX protease family)